MAHTVDKRFQGNEKYTPKGYPNLVSRQNQVTFHSRSKVMTY